MKDSIMLVESWYITFVMSFFATVFYFVYASCVAYVATGRGMQRSNHSFYAHQKTKKKTKMNGRNW